MNMTRRINFALFSAVFEAGVLISATLFLLGLYLQFGTEVKVKGWLIFLLLAIVLSLVGMVWSSYRSSRTLETDSTRAWFRINQQLVRTLRENAAVDVADGLQDLLDAHGETQYQGQNELAEVLERQFGPARALEIRDTVFKYARFKPENSIED